mmetsp:Transcript_26031/g.66098  ORF Transcript_26031/g.66098 Transcript_26031/m.66098 type:complete len:115 (-) Transcript_26031:264-608(-)
MPNAIGTFVLLIQEKSNLRKQEAAPTRSLLKITSLCVALLTFTHASAFILKFASSTAHLSVQYPSSAMIVLFFHYKRRWGNKSSYLPTNFLYFFKVNNCAFSANSASSVSQNIT